MKKTYLRMMLLLSLLVTNSVYAYPPDNAAVIYYQYMVDFSKPEEAVWNQLTDAAKGEIEVSGQIQQYLAEKQQLIDALQTASTIPNCNWGLDLSRGLELELPFLPKMKCFAYIILAEAQLKKQQRQYNEALNLCLTNLRMAGHAGNDTLITYLVGTAMTALTYGAMEDVLSAMPPDERTLVELKRELELPEYNILNIKQPLLSECQVFTNEIVTMSDRKKRTFADMSGL